MNATPASATTHQAHLLALGVVPMQLRSSPSLRAAVSEVEPAETSMPCAPETIRLHLWFAAGQSIPCEGLPARLLDQILASIGTTRAQVTVLDAATADDGVAVLAFGAGAPLGAVSLPTLERLADPLEKRIAWPILRRLRRKLADRHDA